MPERTVEEVDRLGDMLIRETTTDSLFRRYKHTRVERSEAKVELRRIRRSALETATSVYVASKLKAGRKDALRANAYWIIPSIVTVGAAAYYFIS